MFRIDRHYLRALLPRARHDHAARADQRLLVGEGDALFCVYRRERGPQADCAGDCGDDALCTVPGRGLDESGLAAVADGDARALERGAQAFVRPRVEGADVFGAQSLSLLQKQVNILIRGERRGLYAKRLQTSTLWRPMLPVEPRMTVLFII